MKQVFDMATTAGWRVGLMVFILAVASAILEYSIELICRRFRQRKGILRMVSCFKNELFLLGFLSLLLNGIQDSLNGLCISEPVGDTGLFNPVWPYHEVYHIAKDEYFASLLGDNPHDILRGLSSGGQRHLLMASNISSAWHHSVPGGGGKRALQLEASQIEACEVFYNPCSHFRVPLWPSHVFHQVELLLFVVGVTHVVYTGATMLLCLWQVQQWYKWEAEIRSADASVKRQLLPLDDEISSKVEGSTIQRAAAIAVAVFSWDRFRPPVTSAVYKNLRVLFIERMHFDHDFDFWTFISRSMEEQLAVVLRLKTAMFFIAAAILTCPYPSYVPYWLLGISVFLEVWVAAKLGSTAALLAKQVVSKHGEDAVVFCRLDQAMTHAEPSTHDPQRPLARTTTASLPERSVGSLAVSCWLAGNSTSSGSCCGAGSSGGGGVTFHSEGDGVLQRSRAPSSVSSRGVSAVAALDDGVSSLPRNQGRTIRSSAAAPDGPRGRPVQAQVRATRGSRSRQSSCCRLTAHTFEKGVDVAAATSHSNPVFEFHVHAGHRPSQSSDLVTRTPMYDLTPRESEDSSYATPRESEEDAYFNTHCPSGGATGLQPSGHDNAETSSGTRMQAETVGVDSCGSMNSGKPLRQQQLHMDASVRAAAGLQGPQDTATAPAGCSKQQTDCCDATAVVNYGISADRKTGVARGNDAEGVIPGEAAAAALGGLDKPFLRRVAQELAKLTLLGGEAADACRADKEATAMGPVQCKDVDAASLFWFKKPTLVLKVVEYVYFMNSFFLSMVVFAAWQNLSKQWVFLDCPLWLIRLLVCVSVAVLLHSALRVMPLYALIQPIGSHCPANVLKIALKQQARAGSARGNHSTAGSALSPAAKTMFGVRPGTAAGAAAGHSLSGGQQASPRKMADLWLAHHVTSSPQQFQPWKEQVTRGTQSLEQERSTVDPHGS